MNRTDKVMGVEDVMFVIEASLWLRKTPEQPARVREVVIGNSECRLRCDELSKQGYSVHSWLLDDPDD